MATTTPAPPTLGSPPAPIPTPTNAAATATTTGPSSDGGTASATVVKPGGSTSEFVVTMLIVTLGGVLSSGLLVNNTAVQIAGVAMATLKAIAYTWSRTQVKTAMMLGVILFAAMHSSGCASADDKAIRATLATTQIAQAALIAYNDAHETQITSSAPDKATGMANLVAWFAEQAKLEAMIVDVYSGIAAWALVKDSPHLATVITAATTLAAELKASGVAK